jgi:hypothetical protein
VTLDVRTVHLQKESAQCASVPAQVRAIENEKNGKYKAYYSRFRPFVISVTGAVPEGSFGVIKEIAAEAARASRPRLRWEKDRWAVEIVQRIAIAMVKATARQAARRPGDRLPGMDRNRLPSGMPRSERGVRGSRGGRPAASA